MNPDLIITSAHNPTVKLVKALRNRRARDETGLFLIEGYRELIRATTHAVDIEALLYSPELFLGKNEEALLTTCRKLGARLIELPSHLFETCSYRDRPDGLIAIAKKMCLTEETVLKKIGEEPFVVIAEAIEKPGNLGTILRSSDAAGVCAVIVANGCTDIYNPNVVRASVGTLFTIPVIELSNEAALALCRKLKLSLIAASPEASSLYTEIAMVGPVGIIVGTEQTGLSSFWKGHAHTIAKIPMYGISDSLNVATATTLFLFEVARQRHGRA